MTPGGNFQPFGLPSPFGLPPSPSGLWRTGRISLFSPAASRVRLTHGRTPARRGYALPRLFLCQMRDFPRPNRRHAARKRAGEPAPPNSHPPSSLRPFVPPSLSRLGCFFVKCEIRPPTPNATPPTATYVRPAEVMHIKVCTWHGWKECEIGPKNR
jgi:hypothetical protein